MYIFQIDCNSKTFSVIAPNISIAHNTASRYIKETDKGRSINNITNIGKL